MAEAVQPTSHQETTRILSPEVAFATESVASCWDEGVLMMHENHAEVGGLDGRTFRPNRDAFERIEASRHLRFFTMRHFGRLAGYGMFMVAESLNYADTVLAVTHTVYVTPAHRGRRAIQFMLWQDKMLERDGVTDIMRQSPTKHDVGRVYEHMGYHAVEMVYVKAVPRGN